MELHVNAVQTCLMNTCSLSVHIVMSPGNIDVHAWVGSLGCRLVVHGSFRKKNKLENTKIIDIVIHCMYFNLRIAIKVCFNYINNKI